MAKNVLEAPAYGKLRLLRHHGDSVADHSVAVAWRAFDLALRLGVRGRLPELVRGALLHDFFHYDWRKARPRSGGLHGFDHPREAYENAVAVFGPLTAVERDCVLRHMWPLTPIPPRFPESIIVCLADKSVAVRESWKAISDGEGLGVL